MSEENILRSELRWTGIALAAVVVMLAIIVLSAIAFAVNRIANWIGLQFFLTPMVAADRNTRVIVSRCHTASPTPPAHEAR